MAETGTADGVDDVVLELCWGGKMVCEEGGGEAAVRDAFEHYVEDVGVRSRGGCGLRGK